MAVKFFIEVISDFVSYFLTASDELFCGEFSCSGFDGFLNSRGYEVVLVVFADVLVKINHSS